ncbi:HD-GYP domain-containing protein [Bosea sp. ANAM02]|uniref:HD-GYP domain-containing protein n=1 Tax=Bosea sp. ANAM02 TaxID=2020412 RepID=UPI00140F1A4E|nr:HD-GYP domain-containing protein [Bosea sp. ANAM02]BCB19548.1 phosphohydrolase [Bosea sp. ANAM02]
MSIETARAALATLGFSISRRIFLLRDMSSRCQIQANALGATDILPADVPAVVLLERIGLLLAPPDQSDSAAALGRRFVAASAALSDLMGAAEAGAGLPVRAIEDSVTALNRAADGGDLNAWLDMVWRHDDATYQHCLLVSGLAAAFAQRLGFREADRRLIAEAAVLHDIGKARIPLDILRKPTGLSAAEREVMRRHPGIGHDMLVAQGGFAPAVLAAVLSHHEYLDGSGYPQGLSGSDIPDPVRIITICDVYAALIERRSYKPPLPPGEAYAALVAMGGKLDRDLVRVFGEVVLDAAIMRLGQYGRPVLKRAAGQVA